MRIFLFLCLAACLAPVLLSCDFSREKPQPNATPVNQGEPSPGIADTVGINYLMGRFVPEQSDAFALIPDSVSSRSGMYLRVEVLEAFLAMAQAAKKEGVVLRIMSATRNFEYQKRIWEDKWTGRQKLSNGQDAAQAYPDPVERARMILLYSSMPGSSRHHWGTDIDLNAFNNAYFETGAGAVVFDWLVKNAQHYGFCRPYTAKDSLRQHGYEEEKWHWSYAPLAQPMTEEAETKLKNELIDGFLGNETAPEIDVVGKYVLGVHPECFGVDR